MSGFPKSEHLCGQQRIASLYKEGRHFVAYPLRVTWREFRSKTNVGVQNGEVRTEAAVQVLVWAPKALFKHAVDRNRMRRLMREAYRLEKEPLTGFCIEQGIYVEIAFNYLDKEKRSLDELRKAMRKAIEKIQRDTEQNDKG